MLVLALRTDNPQAEIYLYENNAEIGRDSWRAHRELSATIHTKIARLLKQTGKSWHQLGGVIFFNGPGSFTGLRIGVSVVNALGASLEVPVVAARGDAWLVAGLKNIVGVLDFKAIEPFYGSDPHITAPKK